MEFIQLDNDPQDGIWHGDSLCFGLKLPNPSMNYDPDNNDDAGNQFYKFRPHENSEQNGRRGWYCNLTGKKTFKLKLIY